MAPCGRLPSPPLHRAHSEGRLLAKRRTGSAILGSLPELKTSSSGIPGRSELFDSKVLSSPMSNGRNQYRDSKSLDVLMGRQDQSERALSSVPHGHAAKRITALPPILEMGRGMVRQPSSPEEKLRPAKRSRSSTALCSAGAETEMLQEVETRSALKPKSQIPLPPLSKSQSTGALPACQSVKSDNEVEEVLKTALGLCSDQGTRKTSKDHCRSSNDIEAHLEKLLAFENSSRNASPEKKDRRARVADHRGDNENKIRRKGTGFVHLNSSEELVERRVKIDDAHGDNENKIRRKGTGFVHLQSSVEPEERRVKIHDDHGDNENSICRKGTGFVHLGASENVGRRATINDEHGDNENNIRRKGTGFVHLSSSLSEGDLSRAKSPRDHLDHLDKENKPCNKSSCFMHGNSPPYKKNKRCVRIHDHHGDNENKIRRDGTGFVHLSALPKDSPSVWFPDMTGGNVNRIQRKGTGFVMLNHVSPRVRIADSHGDNENNLRRKGTGFIDLSETETDLQSTSSRLCSTGTAGSSDGCESGFGTVDEADGCCGPQTFDDAVVHLQENSSLVELA